MPPCPISRHRQFPGRGPPSSPSPAAARKHSAWPLRVRGGPPCRPEQRRRGRIRHIPPRPHPRPLLQRAQPRQRAVPPPKSGKGERGRVNGAGTHKTSAPTQPPVSGGASSSGTAGTRRVSAPTHPHQRQRGPARYGRKIRAEALPRQGDEARPIPTRRP